MITDLTILADNLREIVEDWDERTSFDPDQAMSDAEHTAAIDFIVKIEDGETLSAKQMKYANALVAKYGTYEGDFYRPSDIGRYGR